MASKYHWPCHNRDETYLNVLENNTTGQNADWILCEWHHVKSYFNDPALCEGQYQQKSSKTVNSAQNQHYYPSVVVIRQISWPQNTNHYTHSQERQIVIAIAEYFFVEYGPYDSSESPKRDTNGQKFFLKQTKCIQVPQKRIVFTYRVYVCQIHPLGLKREINKRLGFLFYFITEKDSLNWGFLYSPFNSTTYLLTFLLS